MKRLICISILIIVIFLVLSTVYWEEPIHKKTSCIQFTIGDDDYKMAKVTIDGIIKKSLIRDNIMEIKISLNGKVYPDVETHPYIIPINFHKGYIARNNKILFTPTDKFEQYIHKSDGYSRVSLDYVYWDESSKRGSLHVFGDLYFYDNFSEFFITLSKKTDSGYSWINKEGYEIVVSGSSIDEAVEVLKEMTNWNISQW